MRTWIALAGILLGGASITAQACDNPPLVKIPAKDKVTKDNVAEVTQKTKDYFAAMEAYRSCLHDKLAKAGGDNAPDTIKKVITIRNNAAVAEEQAVENWYTQNVGKKKAAAIGPDKAKS